MVSAEENTYFLRAFEALGVTETRRAADPDTQPTMGFKAIMRQAADTSSYAAALSVLVVAEWLYLDWASRAPLPLPNNFVHAEWITLHDNPNFRGFVDFLRTELDRLGPAHADCAATSFLALLRSNSPSSKPPIRSEFRLRTPALLRPNKRHLGNSRLQQIKPRRRRSPPSRDRWFESFGPHLESGVSALLQVKLTMPLIGVQIGCDRGRDR
jgi:hypothetical protein